MSLVLIQLHPSLLVIAITNDKFFIKVSHNEEEEMDSQGSNHNGECHLSENCFH